MGAWGAWNNFCTSETFAALVPVAGFVDSSMIEDCKITTIPIRVFFTGCWTMLSTWIIP
jgi:hypothetical protein